MELSEKAAQAKKAYGRDWRRQNRKKINAYHKKWSQENPEKVKQYKQRYWERKAQKMNDTVKDVSVTSRVSVTQTAGQKVCLTCGEFHTPKRSTARYCSDRCRVKHNRQMLR